MKNGAPQSRKEAEKAQRKAQKELPQQKIRAQIKRIMHYIQEVIRYKGGNKYKEGQPSQIKSRKVNYIIKVGPDVGGEGEDSGSEDSALL